MANLARLYLVENLPLHIGTRPGFVKFIRKWEPQWPSISKQSVTRSVECQSRELQKEIQREMEEVAKETDIAFTTDFWTSPTGESSMTISMHWITRDWHLKTHIMGMISFPKDHTTANILEKLMDLPLEFGLYPKSFDGRTTQCPDVVRLDKHLYFKLKPQMDKPVLTSDCGSDVSAGAEKGELGDWNRCACHCLNIAVQAALEEPMIEGYLATLTALARRFSKSQIAWNRFKKT